MSDDTAHEFTVTYRIHKHSQVVMNGDSTGQPPETIGMTEAVGAAVAPGEPLHYVFDTTVPVSPDDEKDWRRKTAIANLYKAFWEIHVAKSYGDISHHPA